MFIHHCSNKDLSRKTLRWARQTSYLAPHTTTCSSKLGSHETRICHLFLHGPPLTQSRIGCKAEEKCSSEIHQQNLYLWFMNTHYKKIALFQCLILSQKVPKMAAVVFFPLIFASMLVGCNKRDTTAFYQRFVAGKGP